MKKKKLVKDNIFLIFALLVHVTYLVFIELKYFSLNTAYLDLGAFDSNIWKISTGDLTWAFAGHFQPVLLLYAVIYKIISGGWLLIFLQWLSVGIGAFLFYNYTKRLLNDGYATLVLMLFILNPCVINIIYFDFHTDHLIIPVMMIFYAYLEGKKCLLRNDKLIVASLAGVMMLIKEPLILAASMLGLIVFSKTKNKSFGIFLFLLGIGLSYIVMTRIIPAANANLGWSSETFAKGPFSYLGNNLGKIVINMFTRPQIWINRVIEWPKIKYLIFIFAPLGFVSLLKPLYLLPIIPILAISMLSTLENYYTIYYHYTAPLIIPIFVAFVHGLKAVKGQMSGVKSEFPVWRILGWKMLEERNVVVFILIGVFISTVFFHVMISHSPFGRIFWENYPKSSYGYEDYLITERSRIIWRAINKYISENPDISISSQNVVNNSYLAHRKKYHCFPHRFSECDYVVLDTKKDKYVIDVVKNAEYDELFESVRNSMELLYSYDGFYIFKAKKRLS